MKKLLVKEVIGDLLEAEEQYIVHQCNCLSTTGGGLAYYLFNKFPYADIYAERADVDGKPLYRDVPGTLKIRGNGKEQRYVINALSQYYPGGVNDYQNDNTQARYKYFIQCLAEVANIKGLKSIAFPYLYGCGIAGGDWNKYYEAIEMFAEDNPNVEVVIYKKPGTF